MSIIVLIFNLGLKKIVGDTCTHGASCSMFDTIAVQTWVSMAIVLIILVIGIIIMFSKTRRKNNWKTIIKRIKDNFFKLHKIRLEVSQEYVENLVNNHYNQEFGARDMQRLIESNIQSKVSKMILEDKIKEGEIVKL